MRDQAGRVTLAVLEALRFRHASSEFLVALPEHEWQKVFNWCDRRQLTFLLSSVCFSKLPGAICEEVLKKRDRFELRFQRLKQELFRIAEALNDSHLEFVMLKGMSHVPALSPNTLFRAQGDIDLWLPGSSVYEARDVLTRLGFVPLLSAKSRHLAPMAKPSNWEWRGDLFDPEMPIAVELHYDLWSDASEHIAIPDLEAFWQRRKPRNFDGCEINVLCEEDLVGFAALHLLLHLLHGDLPLQRAWEIGNFLETSADDELFWNSWETIHPSPLKQIESVVYSMVATWFHCRWPKALEKHFDGLPVKTKWWLDKYCWAPVQREWAPNKFEVGLHLALASSRRDRARVFLQRLLPVAMPGFADRAQPGLSLAAILRRAIRQARLLVSRVVHHVVTMPSTLLLGLRFLRVRRF